MRKGMLVVILLAATSANAAETWWLRDDFGQGACFGAPSLERAPGNTDAQTVAGSPLEWYEDEDRTIAAGYWSLQVDIACEEGGGPRPMAELQVFKLDACNVVTQETLLDCPKVELLKGSNVEYTCTALLPAQFFDDDDAIRVRFNQIRGHVVCSLQYNNATPTHDSRLTHPGVCPC